MEAVVVVATRWMADGGGGRCPWNGVAVVSSGGGCGSECACDKVAAAVSSVGVCGNKGAYDRVGAVQQCQGGGRCGDVEIASVLKQ